MSSVDHIQATAGFGQEWFSEPISPEENLADLQRHQRDFRDKTGFTYTVLDARGPADRAEVIGCVYLYPNDQAGADVEVLSWVRADRAELDALVATTVRAWLRERWPWAAERILDHPRHATPDSYQSRANHRRRECRVRIRQSVSVRVIAWPHRRDAPLDNHGDVAVGESLAHLRCTRPSPRQWERRPRGNRG